MADDAGIAAILADYVPRHEYELTLSALDAATTEGTTHRTAAETATGRLKELEGKYRHRAAKDAYGKAAAKLKVKESLREHAFRLADIPSDVDEPDESAVESRLSKWLEANPDFRDAEPAKPTKPTTIDPGEGSSRGTSFAPAEPQLRVTREQMGNALWMRENQSKVHEAIKLGRLLVDD